MKIWVRAKSITLSITCCAIILASVSAKAADDVKHHLGLNLVSRHFTADNERYCEENPGAFYERRWDRDMKGLQVGYYRNSFCERETSDRIDDTFYALGIYQPWRWHGIQLGGFAGVASGYKKGNLSLLLGGMATWPITKPVALQAIFNMAAVGLQLQMRF